MDRASTYVDDETVELIRTGVVAVGISLQEELKAQDGAGDFFRKVVNQRPEPKHSKQGYYIVSPDGTLLKGWMYPRPDDGTVKRNLKEALAAYQPPSRIEPLDPRVDRGCKPPVPAGVVVVETRSRLYEATFLRSGVDRFDLIQKTMGHDRLWILKPEADALVQGTLPDSLLERILRFHLGDNTRCYLTRWVPDAIRSVRVEMKREGTGYVVEGSAHLEEQGKGFEAKLYGRIDVRDGALSRFDLIAHGTAWGQQNGVDYFPTGKFTVGNAFTLARPGVTFDALPVWGWVPDYMKTTDLRVPSLRGK